MLKTLLDAMPSLQHVEIVIVDHKSGSSEKYEGTVSKIRVAHGSILQHSYDLVALFSIEDPTTKQPLTCIGVAHI